jgi:alcohol dehydrogenase class IV
MLLPAVTGFSINAAEGRYADCSRAMGIANGTATDQDAASALIRGLFQRNQELQVPSPKKYGIAEDQYFSMIPKMAAQALASGSPQNNPRVPNAEEIEQLYREVWG